MTIWQIILYWAISEVIAWGLWCFAEKKILQKKVKNMLTAMLIMDKMGAYPMTQNKTMELIRFIIWPYGIIQRTMVVKKYYKEMTID